MIRIVSREIVRERSYVFPLDAPLPRVSRSLPRRLLRKLPRFEDEAEELVTLRYNLQSRVASVNTCYGGVAWNAAAQCRLQIHYCPDGSLRPHLNVQPAGQAAFAANLAAAGPPPSGQDLPDYANEQDNGAGPGRARILSYSSDSPANPASDSVMRNGDSSRQPTSEFAHAPTMERSGRTEEFGRFPTPEEPKSAGENGHTVGQTGIGYVFLGLLEPGSAQPHIVLSTDAYSLSLLGRYRLLANTLARWTGTTTAVVNG